MIYRAKDDERLDQVVYKYYGHLKYFEQVLELNAKLDPILKAGDIVLLSEIEEATKEQAKLW